MTYIIPATHIRDIDLGPYVTVNYTIADNDSRALFKVTGLVCVTALVGVVTTAITVANTVKLIANPTAGADSDLCLANPVAGVAGTLLGITGDQDQVMQAYSGMMPRFPAYEGGSPHGIYINAGTIDIVTTGTGLDGVVTWHLCYTPVTATGKVEAA